MNPYTPPSKPPTDAEPSGSQAGKSPLREALAATFMVIGVVALVYTLFPWINPPQFRMNPTGPESLPIRSLVGGCATLISLGGAFHFNRRAKTVTRSKR